MLKKALNKVNYRNGTKHDYQVCYGYYWLTWINAKKYSLE